MKKASLYPVLFSPIYKEMVWGGNRLQTMFNRKLESAKTGESWDISCRPNEMGIIENGSHAGLAFDEYIALDKVGILGIKLENAERFPLLVKIIDANDALSIQVHPDDIKAKEKGSTDTGKSEMWYVLHPPHDGNLIIGLKSGVTQEMLSNAYKNGTVEECLNYLPVKTGDIIDIPAGLVHALTAGVIVAEVQQNSDITYRLYDYNRIGLDGSPRELHVDDALNVSDFEEKLSKEVAVGTDVKNGDNTLTFAIANEFFTIVKYVIAEPLTERSNLESFSIFTCVSGSAIFAAGGISVTVPVGRSIFIPANMGEYVISPINDTETVLIKSFV